MSKIHYATGGLITPTKCEFTTLCRRKFPQGHDEIMQSGYAGALNVTCKDCRRILDINESKRVHSEKIRNMVAHGQFDKLKIIDNA